MVPFHDVRIKDLVAWQSCSMTPIQSRSAAAPLGVLEETKSRFEDHHSRETSAYTLHGTDYILTGRCGIQIACDIVYIDREHGQSSGGCEGGDTGAARAAHFEETGGHAEEVLLARCGVLLPLLQHQRRQRNYDGYLPGGSANYQGVKFEQISYDEKMNLVNIWTKVMLRPWPLYWNGPIPLSIFTVCELQDVEVEGKGKQTPRTVKMIKSQRDLFEFSPLVRVIPIVGDIYANQDLRFVIGISELTLPKWASSSWNSYFQAS